jgi:ankyrin repeat protein
MWVGLASITALFFVKPITLAIFAHAGDGGVGYFVVEVFLVMLSVAGIVGIALFEIARLLGPRVRTNHKNVGTIKPESGLLRRSITTLVVLAALAFALRAGAENPLWDAVAHNDIGKAKTLLILGADVNSKNRYGYSILHQAVSGGDAKLVELLISKGADVNAKGQFDRTPLHFAGKKGMAEILLAHGAEVDAQTDQGETPLHWAASSGLGVKDDEAMLNMAEVLIAHGADLNRKASGYGTPLNKAAYFNKLHMAKLLIARGADVEGKGASPLSSAGVNGDYLEMAQLLVENGADVNRRGANGEFPLHAAAFRGNSKVTNFLLSRGANPNATTEKGFTALYYAAGSDYGAASAEELLNYGASPNAKSSNGRTALHQAASQGATKVIEVLLAHKADINMPDDRGYTPLHAAVQYRIGKINVAELLVNNGADVDAKSYREGVTPLREAISTGDTEVVKLLLSHGADVNALSKYSVTTLFSAKNSKEIIELLLAHGAH